MLCTICHLCKLILVIVFSGSVSILPTILFLTTGVLRETAEPSIDGKIAPTVTASLQALRTISTSEYVADERCEEDWARMLRSTLATILDFAAPGNHCFTLQF